MHTAVFTACASDICDVMMLSLVVLRSFMYFVISQISSLPENH